MNSKNEFHQLGIVCVVPVRGNVNEKQAGIFLPNERGGVCSGAMGRGGRGRRGTRAKGQ